MIETILAAEGGAPQGAAIFFPAGYDILWSLVVFVVIAAFFGLFAIPKFTVQLRSTPLSCLYLPESVFIFENLVETAAERHDCLGTVFHST